MGCEAGRGGPQSLPWREIPVPMMNQTCRLFILRDEGAFRPAVSMLSPVHHYVSPTPSLAPRRHLAGSGQGGHPGPLPPSPEPSPSPALHHSLRITHSLLTLLHPLAWEAPCASHWRGTHSDPLSWSPCSCSVLPRPWVPAQGPK